MRNLLTIVAVPALLLAGSAANAQVANDFRGLRGEVQVGGDRFQSQGQHDDKFSYGGAIGFDGTLADKIVIGPEFSYWRSRHSNTTNPLGGTLNTRSRYELGAGVRAGYLLQPNVLVYGIAGYANDHQRRTFTGVNNAGAGAFNNSYSVDGYQVGGGAEFSINPNFYVGAGYRYSNYDNHTARQRAFLSAGVRFK